VVIQLFIVIYWDASFILEIYKFGYQFF